MVFLFYLCDVCLYFGHGEYGGDLGLEGGFFGLVESVEPVAFVGGYEYDGECGDYPVCV